MYLFFDTETTDKYKFDLPRQHPGQPHLVQLAALLFDSQRIERASFHTLVIPDGWAVAREAENVHGISAGHCAQHGLPRAAVLHVMSGMARNAAVMVAHNIQFDTGVLSTAYFRELGVGAALDAVDACFGKLSQFCTMRESTSIVGLPGRYGPKWPKLAEAYKFFFREELVGAHDAMADVRACARIFFALVDRAGPQCVRRSQ